MMRFRYFSNSYFSSILFLILTGLVFIAAIPQQNATRGSSRLRLLNADFSRGVIQNGQALRILEGHVHAIQDSLELFCERAVYYDSKGKITLTGKVRLIQGKDTLLARRVNYFENSKIAIAEGNVQVYRPHQFLKSDYLEYHSDTDQIRANGHLLLHDAKERVFITGAKGEYLPQNDFSYVEKNAHLWRLDSASTDTFHIREEKSSCHGFGQDSPGGAAGHLRFGNLFSG
jgi:lipopolysaccharide export system protein LptA